MAQVIEHENSLAREIKETRKQKLKNFSVGILLALCGAGLDKLLVPIHGLHEIVNIVGVATGIAFLYAMVQLSGIGGPVTTQVGLEGEKRTKRILEGLSDDYTLIQDVTVVADGRPSQIDNVIVGPTGVFIVETKNHNGCIEGNDSDKSFYQYKVGSGGTAYDKEFYSPIKQVGTHAYRLSRYLKTRGVNTWVHPMVFFANPDAEIQVKTQTTPVFPYRKRKKMLKFIQTEQDSILSSSQQARAVEAIKASLKQAAGA